ncbi:MAG TPA: hypothetical protein VGV41_12425 [Pseudolabrys sp.]|uniref:hypothetical protein n=1 Tax=Pseudolabrys sp. TaxID=1960880 RepID=UPI002DDD960D|nr:hypothetical protein [Pseudolabrys sp.]HEV2629437.1 hypothetical protein [Pseudolabrys sp.]
MAKLSPQERVYLAKKRLFAVLERHTVANARTLEQKISDAGPFGQRIDPHVLTEVRNDLVKTGELVRDKHANAPWFYLGNSPIQAVLERLNEQLPIYEALLQPTLSRRVGQALEIATYRALCLTEGCDFDGRYIDLDEHGDELPYRKQEPSQHIGIRSLSGDERLDFIVRTPDAGPLGIECKNVRHWLYPHVEEIKETLSKCIAIDAVPVLIARRIPYVTFHLLSRCGVIVHQTYNQLLPESDAELAAKAKEKTLLGYHDIRLGNEPDARLKKFISKNMLSVAAQARARFEDNKDLLDDFGNRRIPYEEFAGRIRRRDQGLGDKWDPDP